MTQAIKFIYASKTWQGNQISLKMMDEINEYGSYGWKVIQIIERPWQGLSEMTVFFELAYCQEDDSGVANE